ncbi:uncharacterized protein LOC126609170 [Malus sylvestris]|uniref:uncharacterized protein LOC126609170 n=1 Tax=Malus sylvestris TaxID=3752 RepID=UPI0021ACA70A|nr:uncharacterized protein LOC126609170 [Malus sylvestris]
MNFSIIQNCPPSLQSLLSASLSFSSYSFLSFSLLSFRIPEPGNQISLVLSFQNQCSPLFSRSPGSFVFVSYLSGRKWVSEDIAEAVLEQLVSMAKNGASSSNPIATWNAHNISIFCDICIKEVEAGHRPGTHFDKDGYANIRANFKAETGHDYERKQLKNKWDALKNEWKLWKELVGKETGLGWNSSKGTVDASQEWWNNKIQICINKEYGKFRKKGISPKMEDKLDRMFLNTVATGEHAWAPSSGVLPPDTRDESIGQVDSDDEDEIETMQDISAEKREVFGTMKDPEVQLTWLKYLFNKEQ